MNNTLFNVDPSNRCVKTIKKVGVAVLLAFYIIMVLCGLIFTAWYVSLSF